MISADTIERTVDDHVRTAEIRRWLARALRDWEREAVTDVAELVVTELVVNARRHGEPPVTVRAAATPTGVRLEVHDGGDGEVNVLDAGLDGLSGRGLLLVDSMAAEWGWERTDRGGKVVWAEVATTGSAGAG